MRRAGVGLVQILPSVFDGNVNCWVSAVRPFTTRLQVRWTPLSRPKFSQFWVESTAPNVEKWTSAGVI